MNVLNVKMNLLTIFAWLAGLLFYGALAAPSLSPWQTVSAQDTIKPKVVIVSMFEPEADIWYGILDFDVLARNITVPGLSPVYPNVHCTADGSICQVTIGQGGTLRDFPHGVRFC